MRRFFPGFVSVAAGNYVAIILSFGLNVVLTRSLGAHEFGRLALLMMASQVLALFASNWTLTSVVHFGAREFGERGSVARTFWSRMTLVMPWIAAAAVAMWLLQAPLASYLEIPGWGVHLVFVHFLLTTVFTTAGAVLQAMGRMERYGLMLVVDRAVALLVVLVALQLRSLGALGVLACYVAGETIAAVVAFAAIGRRTLAPVAVRGGDLSAMWSFSLPLIASNWIGVFGTQWLDYAIIRRYLPLAELGRYSLAYQVAGVVQQLTIIASTLLLPQFSVLVRTGRERTIRNIVERMVPYWLLAFSAFLGVVLAVVRIAVPALFGEAFADSVPPLSLLLVAAAALAVFNSFTPLLMAHGATWLITGVCLVSAAVNVALNLALIPRFGITGAAAATAVAYGVSAALVLAATRRRLVTPLGRYAALTAPALAVYLCSTAVDGALFYLVAAVALSGAVLALVRMFGLFERSDLTLMAEVGMPAWVRSGLLKVFSLRGGLT